MTNKQDALKALDMKYQELNNKIFANRYNSKENNEYEKRLKSLHEQILKKTLMVLGAEIKITNLYHVKIKDKKLEELQKQKQKKEKERNEQSNKIKKQYEHIKQEILLHGINKEMIELIKNLK